METIQVTKPLLETEKEKEVEENEVEEEVENEVEEEVENEEENGWIVRDFFFVILYIVVMMGNVGIMLYSIKRGDWELMDFYSNFPNQAAALANDRTLLGVIFVGTVVFGYIWIYLLQKFVRVMVVSLSIIGIVSIILIGIYFAYLGFQNSPDSMAMEISWEYSLFAILVSVGVLGFGYVSLKALFHRINLACCLISEASLVLRKTPSLFLAAFFYLSFLFGLFSIYVITISLLYFVPITPIHHIYDYEYDYDDMFVKKVRYWIIFLAFSGFWNLYLVNAIFQMTVAGATSRFYLIRKNASILNNMEIKMSNATLSTSIRALSYSFGSLVLGSLIATIFLSIGLTLRYLRRIRNYNSNSMVYFIMKICQCCHLCLQPIINLSNKFTYIKIALTGQGYFKSASLILKDMAGRFSMVYIVDYITNVVLLSGKFLFISVASVSGALYIMKNDQIMSNYTMVILVTIVFSIMTIFTSLIDVIVNTLLVLYIEDTKKGLNGENCISSNLHYLLESSRTPSSV